MRKMWVAFTCLMLLSPVAVAAQSVCDGADLIDQLPAEETAALMETLAQTPYAEGLLWRASKGNRVIRLFGTYHFHHAQTDAHLERLKPLIEGADRVYLEISKQGQEDMQAAMAADLSMMFITEGPTLPDLLGPEDWQTFSSAMTERNIPGFMAAKFKPFWAAMMLGIGPCEAKSGALEDSGIDTLVAEHADQMDVDQHSLDDPLSLMFLLDADPLEKQLDMIRLSLGWPVDFDDMSYTLRERYLAEQVGLIWSFSELEALKYGGPTAEQDFERFTELLLTERNRNWVDILVAEVADGETVFVAVGAGHLPGEIGVLHMLEQEGFVIERIAM